MQTLPGYFYTGEGSGMGKFQKCQAAKYMNFMCLPVMVKTSLDNSFSIPPVYFFHKYDPIQSV